MNFLILLYDSSIKESYKCNCLHQLWWPWIFKEMPNTKYLQVPPKCLYLQGLVFPDSSNLIIVTTTLIALWINPIIPADAKEFAIIMKIFIILSDKVPEFRRDDCYFFLFSCILLLFWGVSYAREWLCFICCNLSQVIKKNIMTINFLNFADRIARKEISLSSFFSREKI